MKKLGAILMASVLLLLTGATVSAATIADTTDFVPNPMELNLPMTVGARKSATEDAFVSALAVTYTANRDAAVDYKASLDMSPVRSLFDEDFFSTLFLTDDDVRAEFNSGIVTTTVQVAIAYPAAAALLSDVTSSGVGVLNAGSILQETGRTLVGNTLTISYKNQDNLTAGDLMLYKDTYLQDISFLLEDAVTYDTAGDKTVTVTLSGSTEVAFTSKTQTVQYTGTAASVVTCSNASAPVSGGILPSQKEYTVTFRVNGGIPMDSVKVREDGTVTPPVPTREGYTFGGWYADANFEKPFDFSAPIKGHTTLYAKWIEKTSAAPSIILTIGEKVAMAYGYEVENDVAPVLVNDRTMLPIRFVAEALGARVAWNQDTKTVTIVLDNTEIQLTVGETKALVNGAEVALDTASFIENNRTYMPLRFVAENLGALVEWNGEAQKVTIAKEQPSTIMLTIGEKMAVVYGLPVENDVAPVLVNDRTMLPIRFIAEAMGATVGWDEATRAVTITNGDLSIAIVIGEAQATVNGEAVALDAAAFIENSRTYLPLRFVAENLGAKVEWFGDMQKVVITK